MNTKKTAIVQCNCTNGVRWAGFLDGAGQFEKITTIQTPYDVEKFMNAYHLDSITTQYIGCAA